MKQTISRDTPLTELCLRKYEKPYNLSRRDLIKRLCLSLGLLQPGDSRDVIVDVLFVILDSERPLSSEEVREGVIELRKEENLQLIGVAASNIRRQLKRLRELYLIEKIKNNYRITENLTILEIFNEKIEKYILASILERIKTHIREVDLAFNKRKAEPSNLPE